MNMRLSASMSIDTSGGEARFVCNACNHILGPADKPWKPAVVLRERPMRGAGGAGYTAGEQVLLRQFSCPECGALLDTETALEGDPFLTDVVEVPAKAGA